MKMIGQKVVVQVDKDYQDTLELSSGVKLYLDTTYNPTHHVTIQGRVVAAPVGKYVRRSDGKYIKNEIREGDMIWFNYLTVDPTNLVEDTKNCYILDLEMVFCYLRGGTLTATSNHCLVKPLENKTKTFSDIIITGQPKFSKNQGYVRFISTPLKNCEKSELERGDLVWFHERYAFENKINGDDYYVMETTNIESKITEIGRTV
tara:strand:+ start:236 stop:847 length:612 start_codon:yes stop_codon:yes gene_type:complete